MSEQIEIEVSGQPAQSDAQVPAPAAEAPAPAPAAEMPKRRTQKRPADEQGAAKPRAAKPRAAKPAPLAVDLDVRPAPAPAPAATPPEDIEVRVGGQAAPRGTPPPAPFWDAQPADSLYEVEVEVRTKASQQQGQAAAMGEIAAGALQLIGENLRRMTQEQVSKVNDLLGGAELSDYLDPNFWKGIGMALQYQIKEQVEFVQRRMRGEYSVDPYGMDYEVIELVRPFVSFMYHTWWRVKSYGLENVPAEGRALLVSNHSGVLPWDGAMISSAVASQHPVRVGRVVRSLHLHWFSSLPFVAPALAATGQVPGLPENAVRLLENDELVCVFPEGLKGVGKLYKDRYKLARFGRGGFVQAALRAGAPIVPVAVVGAEEIYPMLYNAESFAKMIGFPYFPITPLFPWLGLLGTIPLPTRWSITFCPPISTEEYGPRAADDPLTVLALAERVRDTIQETIDARLAERKSIF